MIYENLLSKKKKTRYEIYLSLYPLWKGHELVHTSQNVNTRASKKKEKLMEKFLFLYFFDSIHYRPLSSIYIRKALLFIRSAIVQILSFFRVPSLSSLSEIFDQKNQQICL